MSDGPPTVDRDRRALVNWLWRLPVLAALGGGVWGAWRYYSVHNLRQPASPNPVFADREPVVVAPLTAFAEDWSDVEFVFAGLPVIALRLPAPVPGGLAADATHLAAWSRICTHEACLVHLSRDPEFVAFAFNYRSNTPSLVCNCHLSVFAPLAAGEAVSGPAVVPLPRVRLELRGDDVVATGIEVAGS